MTFFKNSFTLITASLFSGVSTMSIDARKKGEGRRQSLQIACLGKGLGKLDLSEKKEEIIKEEAKHSKTSADVEADLVVTDRPPLKKCLISRVSN